MDTILSKTSFSHTPSFTLVLPASMSISTLYLTMVSRGKYTHYLWVLHLFYGKKHFYRQFLAQKRACPLGKPFLYIIKAIKLFHRNVSFSHLCIGYSYIYHIENFFCRRTRIQQMCSLVKSYHDRSYRHRSRIGRFKQLI